MNWCRFHHLTPFDLDRRGLSLAAKWLFVCSFNWCSRQESDGRFDKGAELRSIIAEANVPPKTAKELLDAGMWADCGDRYEVKHYLRYQNSNEQIEAQRDRWRRNKKRKDSTEESTAESAVASCVDSPASEKRREEKRDKLVLGDTSGPDWDESEGVPPPSEPRVRLIPHTPTAEELAAHAKAMAKARAMLEGRE